jgi:ABC-type multidrug transport system ATPase subunit
MDAPFLPLSSDEDVSRKVEAYTVDLGFEEVGLVLNNSAKTRVLDSVTGCIQHGQLTAVMGPSGSGKTTFITTLAGRAHYGNQLGQITINGIPGSPAQLRKFVGFVPQEDTMVRCLTVSEILWHEAALRLDRGVSSAAREAAVEKTLHVLGLFAVKDSIVGDELVRGISGGQRKRVNIGMELVAKPTLLFLDEPTSGLDATASAEVVRALASVTHSSQMTVVAVIHQPRFEIFTKFDSILLLGKGGRTAYLGPTVDALSYFQSLGHVCPEHTNPPDFFLDVIVEHSSEVFNAWEQESDIPPQTSHLTPTLSDNEQGGLVSISFSGLFQDIGAAQDSNPLAFFFIGLVTGLLGMSGCIWVQHWVRKGSISRLGAFSFCAGCLVVWILWCVVEITMCVVSWFEHPLSSAAEAPSSMEVNDARII